MLRKKPDGFPTFEHIEITIHKDGKLHHKLVLAITPKSVERLSKTYGKPINAGRGQIHPDFVQNSRGVVVDMTKLGIKTPDMFWRSVLKFTEDMYKTAFSR